MFINGEICGALSIGLTKSVMCAISNYCVTRRKFEIFSVLILFLPMWFGSGSSLGIYLHVYAPILSVQMIDYFSLQTL